MIETAGIGIPITALYAGLLGLLLVARLLHPLGVASEFGLRLPRVIDSVGRWVVVGVASGALVLHTIA